MQQINELCDRQQSLTDQMLEDCRNTNLDAKALRARLAIYRNLILKTTISIREVAKN